MAGPDGPCRWTISPMPDSTSVLTAPQQETQTLPDKSLPKPRRLIELDVLRGFLLVWMTLTHLPTKASVFSNQTFGLVSAAEGFIFLAAFMVGQIEHRAEKKGGESLTLKDIVKRSFRIYLYHCGMLAIAFTIVAACGVEFHRLALENLLSFYMQHPRNAVIAGALLIYRPSLFDILPMYIIFMLLTPVCRRLASFAGWKVVISISVLVWAGAQFGLRNWVYDHVNLFDLSVPKDSTGAFDMWGWQLLWVVGLAAGTAVASRTTPIRLPNTVVITGCIAAIIFFVLRHGPSEQWFNPAIYNALIDKWHLGPLRVLSFASLTIVLIRFGSGLGRLSFVQPLASLGQASLEVFCVHVMCCLIGVSLNADADPMLEPWQQIILLIATFCALFATPWIRNQWRQRRPA
jgi:hypothetical protein